MKIAVPSNDGVNISAHFGRSKGFIVFETVGNQISGKAYLENSVRGHATGQHQEHGNHQGNHGDHTHSHTGILGAL